MNYAVVGSTGMLGKRVVDELHDRGNDVVSTPRIRFGVGFPSIVFSGIDVIINCAGSIDLKGDSKTQMIETNAIGPWQLAAAAEEWGCRLIHMSTDCVFSGQTAYSLFSHSLPDPTSLYGRSKLAGEPWGENVLVVRGSFIGPDHGFFPWVLNAKSPIQAWTAALWNGGSVKVMAKALVDLAEGDKTGILHVAAKRHVSKAWMVEYILEQLDLDITTIQLTDTPAIWRALEPDIVLPPVKDSLDELIEEVNGG